jgi:hypothetical protein
MMRCRLDGKLAGLIGVTLALSLASAMAQSGFREVTAPPPPPLTSGTPPAQGSAPAAAKPRPIPEPANTREGVELAGRYVILREGGKDVGCLLTLEAGARGPQGSMKAQLAPACRDQGIVIFDPIGWRAERGQLILIARKGHSTRFERHQDGAWWKDAKEGGKPLGIRKI